MTNKEIHQLLKIPMSDAARFFEAHRGKEFSIQGKVITKAAAYWLHKQGKTVLLERKDKPGWGDGRLVHIGAYNEYLFTVQF